jgi:adenylate cyclase
VSLAAVLIVLSALAVSVVVVAAVFRVGYNHIAPRIDGRRRRRDDQMFLNHYCRSGLLLRYRRVNRHLPANPRCKFCYVPFGGIGHVFGVKPSRMNPSFCAGCFESAPLGGYETDIGVLFADARGFTAWANTQTPTHVAASLNRFYSSATASLLAHDAIIDKFVGDEVMALFITDMPSLRTEMCDHMMSAAQDLLAAAKAAYIDLPLGVGLHCGTAWVGNVGSSSVRDFTAVGDVVNMAARLQACAGPGQIVLSQAVFDRLCSPPATSAATFVVKGSKDALLARVTPPALAPTP